MQLDLDQNDGMNNLFRAMEADEIQVLAWLTNSIW
jgi:hypothetical protein